MIRIVTGFCMAIGISFMLFSCAAGDPDIISQNNSRNNPNDPKAGNSSSGGSQAGGSSSTGGGTSSSVTTTNTSSQGTSLAAGPVLTVPSTASGNFNISWTFTWPSLTGGQDHYELEKSLQSQAGYSIAESTPNDTRTSPYITVYSPVASDYGNTLYFRVRARTSYGYTAYSQEKSVALTQQQQKYYIKLVNNMSGGGSDEIVQVRISSVGSEIFKDANELLSPDDYTSPILPGDSINPGGYQTWDVTAIKSRYYVFIGLGMWDYDAVLNNEWFKELQNDQNYYIYCSFYIDSQTSTTVTVTVGCDANNNIKAFFDFGGSAGFVASTTDPTPN